MSERVWFKPADGLKVPMNPQVEPGTYFPPEGAWAVRNVYLERRLATGEGTILDKPPESAGPKPAEPFASGSAIVTDPVIAGPESGSGFRRRRSS